MDHELDLTKKKGGFKSWGKIKYIYRFNQSISEENIGESYTQGFLFFYFM